MIKNFSGDAHKIFIANIFKYSYCKNAWQLNKKNITTRIARLKYNDAAGSDIRVDANQEIIIINSK